MSKLSTGGDIIRMKTSEDCEIELFLSRALILKKIKLIKVTNFYMLMGNSKKVKTGRIYI